MAKGKILRVVDEHPLVQDTSGDWTTDPSTHREALSELAARSTGGGGGDAADITYTPGDAGDWPSGDPGNVDDGLDVLADTLASLVPDPTPNLSQVDYDILNGPSGKPTWPPDGGYVNTPGGVDVEFDASGTKHGILDATTDVTGGVQPQVAETDNYAAGAFDTPLTGTDDLKLLVNGSVKHTVDLSVFGGPANDYNGNGSGFTSISAATNVTFDNGDPYTNLEYRTVDKWVVDVLDLDLGYNEIKIQHVTDAGTLTTTVAEVVRDDETQVTTYSGETLANPVWPASRWLSGLQFYTGAASLDYAGTASHAYKNTYVPGTGQVTFEDSNNNLGTIAAETLAASGGDETKAHSTSLKTILLDQTKRILGGSAKVKMIAARVLAEHGAAQSTGATSSTILYDGVTSPADTDLIKYFNNELYRYHFGSDFNSKTLAANWDNTQSLIGASGDHNDGLQVINSRLDYPELDFGPVTYRPGLAPAYDTAAGIRYYADRTENAIAANSFRVLLSGSFTLIADAIAFGIGGSDKIKVMLRWPTQTGWLDLAVNFSEGSFGAVGEASRFGLDNGDSLTHGCRDLSLDSGGAYGVKIGTKTTANSGDRFYLRIITDDLWGGYIDTITVEWGA